MSTGAVLRIQEPRHGNKRSVGQEKDQIVGTAGVLLIGVEANILAMYEHTIKLCHKQSYQRCHVPCHDCHRSKRTPSIARNRIVDLVIAI